MHSLIITVSLIVTKQEESSSREARCPNYVFLPQSRVSRAESAGAVAL